MRLVPARALLCRAGSFPRTGPPGQDMERVGEKGGGPGHSGADRRTQRVKERGAQSCRLPREQVSPLQPVTRAPGQSGRDGGCRYVATWNHSPGTSEATEHVPQLSLVVWGLPLSLEHSALVTLPFCQPIPLLPLRGGPQKALGELELWVES